MHTDMGRPKGTVIADKRLTVLLRRGRAVDLRTAGYMRVSRARWRLSRHCAEQLCVTSRLLQE